MESFIKWMGGKSQLRDEIIPMIPPHKTYIEPFAGASWILFGKPPSPVEVLNDVDNDLVNLYLAIQNNLDDFLSVLENVPISETLFNDWGQEWYTPKDHGGIPVLEDDSGMKGIPDADLAGRFYFVLMNSFNGMISRPVFSIQPDHRSSFVKFYRTDWDAIMGRLKKVQILCRDFGDVIETFDSTESFFYLDPPYTCATVPRRYYRYTFSGQDHDRLAVYLSDIKGKFILSYDNVPVIRERYTDFSSRVTSTGELLIYNYDLPDPPFYCREGIPGSNGIPRRSAWYTGNCPYCESRLVQQLYKRVTLENGSRSFKPKGYTCLSCDGVFR